MNTTEIIRVACAEDHEAVQAGIKFILEGYNFISPGPFAGDGKQMIEMLEFEKTPPDICIIDINMPIMDGFTLQEQISVRWPEMKTLAYTAYHDESYVIKMITLGANGYLLKSAPKSDLINAILSIHKYGFYYNDMVDGKKLNAIHSDQHIKTSLLEREEELLRFAACELSFGEIADKMNIPGKTLENIRYRLYKKLNITNRLGLAMYAKKHGYGPFDDASF